MTVEHNRKAVRRFMEQGFNRQDMAEFARFFAEDAVNHVLPPGTPGRAGTQQFAGMFFNAFPDIKVTIEDVLAEGDRVVVRYVARGTHRGELMGIPPTGRSIAIGGMTIDRLVDGQSVEHWEIFDQMAMMQQLGVMPAADGA